MVTRVTKQVVEALLIPPVYDKTRVSKQVVEVLLKAPIPPQRKGNITLAHVDESLLPYNASSAPLIATNPQDALPDMVTDTAYFYSSAVNWSELFGDTVQWEVSLDGIIWVDAVGGTGENITITNASAMNGNYYRALYTKTGGATLYTDVARITPIVV